MAVWPPKTKNQDFLHFYVYIIERFRTDFIFSLLILDNLKAPPKKSESV